MPRTSPSRAALLLAAIAGIAGSAPLFTTPGSLGGPALSERSNAQQPGERAPVNHTDTKAARLGTGYARRWRAPRGKRYSASVRQHQRHAAKARNRRRARS